jgi:hypothetical protein
MADASFMGEYPWDMASYYTATAGDVNGDGLDDMLVSVTHNDEGGDDAGQVYLILGRAAADWGRDFLLSGADASFIGEDIDDRIGRAVVGVGDVNNDGLGDFMIGSVSSDDGAVDAGETYLILGRAAADWGMDMPIELADASFVGEGEGDESGRRMAGVGDVNGDGFDDFIIGASKNDEVGPDAGKTYLFLGNAAADWGTDLSLAEADAIFLGEERRDQSGRRVSGAGDPNNDGYDDFLIGAPHNSRNGEAAGVAYLIYGRPEADWGTEFSLANADVAYLGKPEIGVAGYDVAWVGDFDGDLIDDFLVAAYGGRNNESVPGEAYLLLGNDLPTIDLTLPLDGASFDPMTAVTFAATAFDNTDGNLTSQIIWTSNLDGEIGQGGNLFDFLSVGQHVITAAATDSGGFTIRAQVTINVVYNSTPEVEILFPQNNAVVSFGETVTFRVEAMDLEDGEVSDLAEWHSSLDGPLGVGEMILISDLSAGLHEITAEVTDSGGLTGSAEVILIVNDNQAPEPVDLDTEFDSGEVGTWHKFLALFGDENGSAEIGKTQIVLEPGSGTYGRLSVRYLLNTNQILLQESSGGGWIGPCVSGDDLVLSNGEIEVDCKLSTPIFIGDNFVKIRIIARWMERISDPIAMTPWLWAADQDGNSSGFVQFDPWMLIPR